MVLLDVTTGLRRSELLALKWSDVDFSTLELNVVRSIYLRMVGNCKTETSRRPVPLDVHVATDLWLWKEASAYSKPDDWIFASPHTRGRFPYWPDALLLKIIQPAALRAGIKKRIGWYTFRHSYSSLLVGNGENVKVVQELMRHASSRFTLVALGSNGGNLLFQYVACRIFAEEPRVPSCTFDGQQAQTDAWCQSDSPGGIRANC
jgi:integrase